MSNSIVIIIFTSFIGVAFIAYTTGERRGFQKGLQIAKNNSSNLITQLKNANSFASNLREKELEERDDNRSTEEIN